MKTEASEARERIDDPDHLLVVPLVSLLNAQRPHYETPPDTGVWPEIGSRGGDAGVGGRAKLRWRLVRGPGGPYQVHGGGLRVRNGAGVLSGASRSTGFL